MSQWPPKDGPLWGLHHSHLTVLSLWWFSHAFEFLYTDHGFAAELLFLGPVFRHCSLLKTPKTNRDFVGSIFPDFFKKVLMMPD